MGDADTTATHGYDSSPFKRLMVTLNHRFNCLDSLGHPNIRQEYQSRVRNASQVDELSKVLVQSDENPALCSRSFEQRPVSGIRAKGLRLVVVVSVAVQPLRQPAPGTPVGQESHCLAIAIGASVSPAMTVWA